LEQDPTRISSVQQITTSLETTSGHTTSTLEEEEKVIWAICPNCHRIGKQGRVYSTCEDMEMIYKIPLEDEDENSQNHNDIDLEIEVQSKPEESKDENNSENHDDIEEELG